LAGLFLLLLLITSSLKDVFKKLVSFIVYLVLIKAKVFTLKLAKVVVKT